MFLWILGLAAAQSWGSLWTGIRFWRYVRAQLKERPQYTPSVAVIVPCRGVDPGFQENIRALLRQDYPHYEVIFVVESRSDPAYGVIRRLLEEEPHARATILEAGLARDCGQKVHNLLMALEHMEARADDPQALRVYAFTDSDAHRDPQWLRHLVGPLESVDVGVTTGYRWYLPSGNFASLLRSLWNASIVTALGPHRRNFAWGGSMALRAETVRRIRLREYWRGSVSDDYQLTEAVRRAGGSVVFVPRCLLPSGGDCSLRDVVEFTTRQIIITRRYAPHLWFLLSASTSLFLVAFFWSGGEALLKIASGQDATRPLIAFLAVYLPGVLKALVRMHAVEHILPAYREQLRAYRVAYGCLYPLASLLFLYNCAIAAFSRRICWRGIRYELRAPNRTVVLDRR